MTSIHGFSSVIGRLGRTGIYLLGCAIGYGKDVLTPCMLMFIDLVISPFIKDWQRTHYPIYF